MTSKQDRKAGYVKVTVLMPFERYKTGDTPSLPPQKAAALEKQGMVKAEAKTAKASA